MRFTAEVRFARPHRPLELDESRGVGDARMSRVGTPRDDWPIGGVARQHMSAGSFNVHGVCTASRPILSTTAVGGLVN